MLSDPSSAGPATRFIFPNYDRSAGVKTFVGQRERQEVNECVFMSDSVTSYDVDESVNELIMEAVNAG